MTLEEFFQEEGLMTNFDHLYNDESSDSNAPYESNE